MLINPFIRNYINMKNTFTVYEILNISNNKRYIGCSSDVKSRWNHHKHLLRLNKHNNKYLQSSWNKYGEDQFIFTILFQFNDINEMYTKEKELVELNSNLFYNLSDGGKGGTAGFKWTDESRKKLSESKKLTAKNIMTQEVKDRISVSKKGSVMHAATRIALQQAKQKKCIANGIVYNSIKEAAESNNFTVSKMRRLMHSDNFIEYSLL